MSLCMLHCSEEEMADEGGGLQNYLPLCTAHSPPFNKSPVPLSTKSYCQDFTGLQEYQQHCVKH